MNEQEFQELLAMLGLPSGSVSADVHGAVRNMLATIHSVGADEDTEEARAIVAAATARLSRLTGESTLAAAVVVIEKRFDDFVELEKKFSKERDDRKTLEMSEYRTLTAKLVKLDVETPFSAWQDEKRTIPAKHIQAMSLPELRNRVKHFEAARNGGPKVTPLGGPPLGLSDTELAMCERKKVKPEEYAKVKAQAEARTRRDEVPSMEARS